MKKETELKLLRKIEALEKEIKEIKGENKEQIPTYQYSKIRDIDLDEIVNISQKLNRTKFNKWFINDINISNKDESFLLELLEQEENYISLYNEETLKMRFLSPLLRRINFKTDHFQDFYNEKIIYKTDKFILNGEVDFVISTGLRRASIPYFFIQEFKRSEEYGNPRPQLLAELISAVELNGWKQIKGAYIIGENWNFVILEKLDKDKYQYFISRTFNSTVLENLKEIFKNLLFVKNEIIKKLGSKSH
ncbi:hypothetical protein PN36_03730 [Candidatus Thiomargarita nelsonii]|uniref:Uncharacterized protein n=1 Tax=Candidatus Thiomargarita nelsonii TaxID=1003181 RepID=A0A0A6P5R8_9GAMM|nr:hypothetical protein PN36_03730 [Candidatus Thiomargarita nelsonii]